MFFHLMLTSLSDSSRCFRLPAARDVEATAVVAVVAVVAPAVVLAVLCRCLRAPEVEAVAGPAAASVVVVAVRVVVAVVAVAVLAAVGAVGVDTIGAEVLDDAGALLTSSWAAAEAVASTAVVATGPSVSEM